MNMKYCGLSILTLSSCLLLSSIPMLHAKPNEILTTKSNSPSTSSWLGYKKRIPAGSTWTNKVGIEFCWCPPGKFTMGSPILEDGRFDDEHMHSVSITKGFWISKFEITYQMWSKTLIPGYEETIKRIAPEEPPYNVPIVGVKWFGTQRYLEGLNKLDPDNKYRLPTEAEWEYACRAGTLTPFNTTGTITQHHAKMQNRKRGYNSLRYLSATTVGSFTPNNWGIHDMHGNVSEWCQDWYGPYKVQKNVQTDPKGPNNGQYRVIRGGNFKVNLPKSRSACRNYLPPDSGGATVGFRIVMEH